MTFGERVRQLRKAKVLTLRQLSDAVGVGFTYLSRIETCRLTYRGYPSEALIHKLAEALDADENELLLLAEKIPKKIVARVLERPDAFLKLANLDDLALDKLLRTLDGDRA